MDKSGEREYWAKAGALLAVWVIFSICVIIYQYGVDAFIVWTFRTIVFITICFGVWYFIYRLILFLIKDK